MQWTDEYLAMMLRARRDRIERERDWDLARMHASTAGIIPAGEPRLPTLAAVPRGHKHTVRPTGTIEYYD